MTGVDTVVLGVKNRQELRERLAAEARGRLGREEIDRFDGAHLPRFRLSPQRSDA